MVEAAAHQQMAEITFLLNVRPGSDPAEPPASGLHRLLGLMSDKTDSVYVSKVTPPTPTVGASYCDTIRNDTVLLFFLLIHSCS